jgi:uracil-DNA glycosylase family 4
VRVWGEGPWDAEVMLVGEAPGAYEESAGRPFLGKAGMELNRFLHAVGLRRNQMFVTNLVKERPPDNRDPLPEEIARDEQDLIDEIETVQPRVIGGLGRFATRWLLGERGRDFLMEDMHGVPRWSREFSFGRAIVVPVYHPAAGLYDPSIQTNILYDLQQLKSAADGLLVPHEGRGVKMFWTDQFLDLAPARVVAIDTEGSVEHPWGLSVCSENGFSFVIRAGDRAGIAALQEYLDAHDPTVVAHYALHDIPVWEAMGLRVNPRKLGDTMIMAYLLGVEPQGLKALAFRHLGLKMPSYSDIVYEAGGKIAREYIERVWGEGRCPECQGVGKVREPRKDGKGWKKTLVKCPQCGGRCARWPAPEPAVEIKNGQVIFSQPQAVGRRLRSIMKDSSEGKLVDFRGRWGAVDPLVRAPVEEELGPMPEATLDDVPEDVAVRYSALDALVTFLVFKTLRRKIRAWGMGKILDIDTRAIASVDRMMRVGVHIDREHFQTLASQFRYEREVSSAIIRKVTGREVFNPGSPYHVADLVFREWKIVPPKLTKTGMASTDDSVLAAVQIQMKPEDPRREIIDHILNYRELDKLLGTYVGEKALPAKADEGERIHTTLKLTRTETGRPASANPNMQNIPARTDRGMSIRAGITAPEGRVLIAADYAQIEVRVLAHISQDRNLIDVIRNGRDLHTSTAALMFSWPGGYEAMMDALARGDGDAKKKRTRAKNATFGIFYRISAQGLLAQFRENGIDATLEECQAIIDLFLTEAYPGIGEYFRETDSFLRQNYYVEDLFGRRRWLPSVHSTIDWVRGEAERQGTNFPIQSTAAGILKLAMIDIDANVLPRYREGGAFAEMILPVHDELVFEADKGVAEELRDEVLRAMERVLTLDVPLTAEAKIGQRWSDLK